MNNSFANRKPAATSRLVGFLLAFAAILSLSACSSTPDAQTSSEVVEAAPTPSDGPQEVTSETEPASDESLSELVPPSQQAPVADNERGVHGISTHPSGVQARVTGVQRSVGTELVQVTFTNGRSDRSIQIRLTEDDQLVNADGSIAAVASVDERLDIEAGEEATVVLAFEAATSSGVELRVGYGAPGASDSSRTASAMAFTVPVDLDAPVSLELPEPVSAANAVLHPNGLQLELSGIVFEANRIGAGFTVRHGGNFETRLFDIQHTYLQDDLGNRYWVMLPSEDDSHVSLDLGDRLTGVLAFGGRIDPAATELTLVINDQGSATSTNAALALITLGPISLTQDGGETFLPANIGNIGQSAENAIINSGVRGEWDALTFFSDYTEATVLLASIGDEAIRLNNGNFPTYIVDDLGNEYRVQPPAGNPDLEIGPGESYEGQLVFTGRLDPEATTLAMRLRYQPGADRDAVFLPVSLDWQAVDQVDPPGFMVAGRSVFEAGSLEQSEIERVTEAIDSFDGVEVDDGILLTLPATVLFDVGEFVLRPDALDATDQLLVILNFYANEDVVVIGHTDNTGTEAANVTLSQNRADAVLAQLIAGGIEPSRLSANGQGEQQPVATNDSDEGRQQNRRVEVLVRTDQGIPTPG